MLWLIGYYAKGEIYYFVYAIDSITKINYYLCYLCYNGTQNLVNGF
jgi:hypothetical protein